MRGALGGFDGLPAQWARKLLEDCSSRCALRPSRNSAAVRHLEVPNDSLCLDPLVVQLLASSLSASTGPSWTSGVERGPSPPPHCYCKELGRSLRQSLSGSVLDPVVVLRRTARLERRGPRQLHHAVRPVAPIAAADRPHDRRTAQLLMCAEENGLASWVRTSAAMTCARLKSAARRPRQDGTCERYGSSSSHTVSTMLQSCVWNGTMVFRKTSRQLSW